MSIRDMNFTVGEVLRVIDTHYSELRSAAIELPGSPCAEAWSAQLNIIAEIKLDLVDLFVEKFQQPTANPSTPS